MADVPLSQLLGDGGIVVSVVGGTGLDVDASDPANPVVNLDAPAIADLALAATAVQPADSATTLNMATARLLGRSTGGAGAVEEITLGTNLSFTANTLNAAGSSGSAAAGYAAMRLKASGFRATSDYGGTPTQTLPPAVDRMYAQPFTVDRAITLTAIGGENTTTNATAGAKFRVAIFDNVPVSGLDQPGNLLVESGDLAVNVTGVKTSAISLALSPGVIYWAVHLNNISVQYRCYDFNFFPAQWLGRNATNTNQPLTHLTSNAAGGGWTAFPTAWSGTYTAVSSNVPAVFLVE